MSVIIGGPVRLDMDNPSLDTLDGAAITSRSRVDFEFDLGSGQHIILTGFDFTYDGSGRLSGGIVTGARETVHGELLFDAKQFSISVQDLSAKMNEYPESFFFHIGQGGETVVGGNAPDNILIATSPHSSITGGSSDDFIVGSQGPDTLIGGAGNDHIISNTDSFALPWIGVEYGGYGNDTIEGSAFGNDLINGNQGDDSINGRGGNNTLLGGQGNDFIDAGIYGSRGNIVNGNLGNDTITSHYNSSYQNHDTLRGGQGDDLIIGNRGDWIAGDLGSNTLTGGQSADTFCAGAGHDLVTNFSTAGGDRVLLLAPGVTYSTSQVGADVEINFSNGGQMVLQNTQMSSLGAGWITNA